MSDTHSMTISLVGLLALITGLTVITFVVFRLIGPRSGVLWGNECNVVVVLLVLLVISILRMEE